MARQVAIVTGGAQGIGKEHARVLMSRNINVVIADIQSKGNETADELRKEPLGGEVSFKKCDVRVHSELKGVFQKTMDKYGRLDILVNNAGVLDEREVDSVIAVNLRTVIEGTNLGVEYMSKANGHQGGVIINMASTLGLVPSLVFPVYCATKYAVVGYTRSMAASCLDDHGVRINCICPDVVDTDMLPRTEEIFFGGKSRFETYTKALKEMAILSPKTVAACLIPLIEDATLNGAAMLCTKEEPATVLDLPDSPPSLLWTYSSRRT